MKSPFMFGSTVSMTAFTNRKSELNRLQSNLLNGINTTIISPRRWGKSSLVEKMIKNIKRQNKEIVIISIDLFSIQNQAEFLSEFAKQCIRNISDKWEEWAKAVKDTFKKLVPKLVVNADMGDFTLEFDWVEIIKQKDEILNLPEKLAGLKKKKVIICIDEFQNIRNFDDQLDLERAMRAHWQRHKNVTYCLYGSKRHMMTDIFNKSSNPFYRFGDIILLNKISSADWYSFIIKNFERSKKIISEEQAAEITQLMDNHAWYIQQLAHYTWIKTDQAVSTKGIQESFEEIIASQLPFFQSTIERISNTQINLLKAILSGEHQYTATAVMRKYGLGTPNNVRKNIRVLEELDIIDKYEGQFIFLDPVFKVWMTRTFNIV